MGTDGRSAARGGHARLGELCLRLTDPSGSLLLGERGLRLVEFITSELRTGRHPDELDDVFDELEEELLAAGHSAGLGSYRTTPAPPTPGFQPLPGTGHRHTALHVLACPQGHCERVEAPDDDSPPPGCRIFDQPLRPVPLR
ncbi:hypothetical protein ACFWGR_11230 [Streptomyces sp. NPDC060311]|uniref:hypothetical protein n=1 Tax=Streptomyces TaxID=1883 RepID=UPI00210B0CE9|nr:hypothetical protein [Streptomyces coelicoflavus]MCQ4203917.1 hypothetical protein [Streptomyces coelicoflavus]